MQSDGPLSALLSGRTFPGLAARLRARKTAVLARWEREVRQLVPVAETFSVEQLLDSLPPSIDAMAAALESSDDAPTRALYDVSRNHGATRHAQGYNLGDLILEYRLWRRVVFEETWTATEAVPRDELVALNLAVDLVATSGTAQFAATEEALLLHATEEESRFLAFLSHELRNHLNQGLLAIQVQAERARTAGRDVDARGLDATRTAIRRSMEATERIMRADWVRHRGKEPKRGHVDLVAAITGAIDQYRLEAETRGLRFELHQPPTADAISDAELIILVIQNLVGNAVKYARGGTIHVEALPWTQGRATGWSIAVRDEGPGIAAERVQHLFDPFERGHGPQDSGMGLGLAIAHRAAERIGGTIEVDSREGAGSSFTLRFPNRPSPLGPAAPRT